MHGAGTGTTGHNGPGQKCSHWSETGTGHNILEPIDPPTQPTSLRNTDTPLKVHSYRSNTEPKKKLFFDVCRFFFDLVRFRLRF